MINDKTIVFKKNDVEKFIKNKIEKSNDSYEKETIDYMIEKFFNAILDTPEEEIKGVLFETLITALINEEQERKEKEAKKRS